MRRARWTPPVVGGEQNGKEGVEDEGATGAQAGVPEVNSGETGEVFIEGTVTPLTVEDQGERANIQNGIGEGAVRGGEVLRVLENRADGGSRWNGTKRYHAKARTRPEQ